MEAQARRRTTVVSAAIAVFVLSFAWVVSAATPAHAAVTMSISGQVVLPGDADAGNFQGIQVWAQRTDGGVDTVPGGFDYGYTGINSSDGQYSVGPLNPGVYTVQFRMLPYGPGDTVPQFVPEYFSNSYTEVGATSVDVTTANATNVHAILEWAGSISGTVTLGADVRESDQQGIRVYALGADDYASTPVAVETDGSYTIPLLPAGDYTVVFSHVGYLGPDGWTLPVYRDEVYNNAYNVADADAVTVGTHPAVTGIDALLELVGHFTASPTPVITHLALTVGSTLGISSGSWSPQPDAYGKRWYRNGVAISGATGSQYDITPSDRGTDITFKLTASRNGFTTVSRTSLAVHVPKVFTRTVTPTITGTAKSGHTLTAVRGTWSPTATYSYQWYRSGVKITGATHKTYKLTSSDKGKVIKVKVTGKRTGYLTVTKTSGGRTVAK